MMDRFPIVTLKSSRNSQRLRPTRFRPTRFRPTDVLSAQQHNPPDLGFNTRTHQNSFCILFCTFLALRPCFWCQSWGFSFWGEPCVFVGAKHTSKGREWEDWACPGKLRLQPRDAKPVLQTPAHHVPPVQSCHLLFWDGSEMSHRLILPFHRISIR